MSQPPEVEKLSWTAEVQPGGWSSWLLSDVTVYDEEILGRGRNGTVVAGLWRSQPVAVKCLTESSLADKPKFQRCSGQEVAALTAEERRRLLVREVVTETAFLVSLRNRCVVEILGVAPHPRSGLPCVVTERLLESLAQRRWRSSQRLTLRDIVDVASDVVSGLRYLHESRVSVAHRNVTSSNILLSVKGKAKLGGLGMAKVLTGRKVSTCAPGEEDYMPPEAYLGETPTYSVKVDVFSLSVVVMEMVVHRAPRPKARFARRGVGTSVVIVSEAKRRADDLQDVKTLQPALLSFVENGLKDERRRPTAAQCDMALVRLRSCNKQYQQSPFTLNRSRENLDDTYSLAGHPDSKLMEQGEKKKGFQRTKVTPQVSVSSFLQPTGGVASNRASLGRCVSLDIGALNSQLTMNQAYTKISRLSLNPEGFVHMADEDKNDSPLLNKTPVDTIVGSAPTLVPEYGTEDDEWGSEAYTSFANDDVYMEPQDAVEADTYMQGEMTYETVQADNTTDDQYMDPQDALSEGLPENGYEEMPDDKFLYDDVILPIQAAACPASNGDPLQDQELYDEVDSSQRSGVVLPPLPRPPSKSAISPTSPPAPAPRAKPPLARAPPLPQERKIAVASTGNPPPKPKRPDCLPPNGSTVAPKATTHSPPATASKSATAYSPPATASKSATAYSPPATASKPAVAVRAPKPAPFLLDGVPTPWFHGPADREDAEQRLRNCPIGTFLVRSGRTHCGYSLSWRSPQVEKPVKHVIIDQQGPGRFQVRHEDEVHQSLHELIEYHKKNKLTDNPADTITNGCPHP